MTDATADVLVVFGITGDLAKVMTFRSLYRLERRGLLDCPIVGVAVDDWTVDQLVGSARATRSSGRASSSTRRCSTRSPSRLSYVQGDFGDAATYQRVGEAIDGQEQSRLLPRDPAVPVREGRQGPPDAGLTADARVVVEKPFGHDKASATALAGGAPPVHRRVAALPDRPLPREDGSRGDPPSPLCEHDARAGLEPQLPLQRRDHDGGGLRRRGPRPLLRSRRRAARRRRQPSHAGRRRRSDGGAVARRSDDDQGLAGRALPRDQGGRSGALRARPVRRLPLDRRRRLRLDHGDLRGAPARDRELALGRRAVLHPHRQAPAGDADGAAARLPPPAEARLRDIRLAASRTSSSSSSTPPRGYSCSSRRTGPTSSAPRRSRSTWSSRRRAARARHRTRCCCTRRSSATRPGSHARTASRRRGGSCSRCSTRRRPSTAMRPARGGRRRRTRSSPGTAAGTGPGSSNEHGALRRRHRRHRRRRRHARPAPRAFRQADPSARTRRLAPARARELDRAERVRRQPLRLAGHLVRREAASRSSRRSTTSSAGRRSSTAPRSTGCARRTSASCTHHDGLSPAWPISYDELEPYYTQAEQLYEVHGARGEDPTEPPASAPYPFPAVSHEPRIQQLADDLAAAGYHPFHAPCGVRLNEANMPYSACVRCMNCDGFPCAVHGKSDAEVLGVRPALEHANVTLLTNAQAVQARDERGGHGGDRGRRRARRRDRALRGDIVVARLRRGEHGEAAALSASDKHPNGLANGSDQVGRNYMFHNSQAVLALSREENPTVFQKTLGLNDFYFGTATSSSTRSGTSRWSASRRRTMYRGEKPMETKLAPEWTLERIAKHAIDFWLSTEDLPLPENRVTVDSDGSSRSRTRRRTTVPKQKLLREAQVDPRQARHARGPPDQALRVHEERDPGRRRRAPGRHLPVRSGSGDAPC